MTTQMPTTADEEEPTPRPYERDIVKRAEALDARRRAQIERQTGIINRLLLFKEYVDQHCLSEYNEWKAEAHPYE